MAEGFTCAVKERDEQYLHACAGGDYRDTGYCVLHAPVEEKKKEDFEEVKKSKLDRKDYNFAGTLFPEGTSAFEGREFDVDTIFAGATFLGETDFTDAHFSGYKTDFSRANFSGNWTDFTDAHFSGNWTSFSDAHFNGKLTYFPNAQFRSVGKTDFSGAHFSAKETYFAGANFSAERTSAERTDFSGARFNGELTYFSSAEFRAQETSFSGAHFCSAAQTDFSNTCFSGEQTQFVGAHFSGEWTRFSKAKFRAKKTYFSSPNLKAQFGAKRTDFTDARFNSGELIYFSGAQFNSEQTDFSLAQFSGKTNFKEASFSGQTVFRDTSLKYPTFEGATFHGDAVFTSAAFCATCDTCDEEKRTDFRRATFKEEAYFREVHFTGYTDFYRARFLGAVKFIGAENEMNEEFRALFPAAGRVSFNRALIDKPELFSFDTVKLRPNWFVGVDARKFRFTQVQWYGLPGGPKGCIDNEISILTNGKCGPRVGTPHNLLEQICRELHINYEESREYTLANEFHYWSMDAVRKESWSHFTGLTLERLAKKETWRDFRKHFGLVTTLYWALSGYGVRAGRAFMVLVGMWAFFALLYMVAGHKDLRAFSPSEFRYFAEHILTIWARFILNIPLVLNLPSLSAVRQSIADILQALVYSLGALARLRPEPRPNGVGWFQFFVIAEGILGPLQIALLALAIRRKVMR